MLSTTVHHNADGTLVVLPRFLQKPFGTWVTNGIGGACLLMQLASIYNTMLHVDHDQIQAAIARWSKCGRRWGDEGFDLVSTQRVLADLSPWKLTGVIKHTVDTAPLAIEAGKPVLLAVDSVLMDNTDYLPESGVMQLNPYHNRVSLDTGCNHALLIIGYDNQQRMFIVRESRSIYTNYGGLLKITRADLLKWKRGWLMVELVFSNPSIDNQWRPKWTSQN